MVTPLVSCAWLKQQLDGGSKGIRVLDGTFVQPMWKRDADQEYLQQHIEGAGRFDIRVVADKSSPLPLMLPSAEQFAEQVGKMGISNETHVVLYENNANFGFYSIGRVWWMFQVFGHKKVSILNGGLPKWLAEGYPTVSGPAPQVDPCTFRATYNTTLVRDYKQMLENFSSKTELVIDARPKGRFEGTAPEPNPSLRSGHILGTTNLPFLQMVDPQTKTFKDKAALQEVFDKAGVNFSKPVVITCGGAVVAPLLLFAAHLLGKDSEMSVYDFCGFKVILYSWYSCYTECSDLPLCHYLHSCNPLPSLIHTQLPFIQRKVAFHI